MPTLQPVVNFSTWLQARIFFLVGLFGMAAGNKKAAIKTSGTLFQTALNAPFYRLLQLRVGFWLIQRVSLLFKFILSLI